MSEDYIEDFEEVVEEIESKHDTSDKTPRLKSNKYGNSKQDENSYRNGKSSENRNQGMKQNTSKTNRKTYALKPITNSTRSKNQTTDGDIEEAYGDRQRERTPPKRRGGDYDFELGRGSNSKPNLSVSKDYNKVSQSSSFLGYYDQYKNILENNSSGKSMRELEHENEKLREYLKDMNNQLSKFVDHTSIANFAPKKQLEFKYKSLDDKHRVISKEINNNLKIYETTYEEYHKLKDRLEVIKSPEYMLELEEKTEDTLKQIEKIKKSNVKLNLQAHTSAKDLNVIETDGLPNTIRDANDKAKQLAIIKRKLEKLIESNKQFEKEKEEKTDKAESLQSKYEKLLIIAEDLKVITGDPKRIEKYNALKKQIATLEEGTKFLEHNNQKYLENHLVREVEELLMNNEREKDHIKKLEEMIIQQKNALMDMIEKEGLKERNDRTTKEVVRKIQLSIERNEQIDASILEGENTGTNKDAKKKGGKPPLSKDAKKDIYDGLPLFSPTKMKKEETAPKKMIIRKTELFNDKKSPRHAEEAEEHTEKPGFNFKVQRKQEESVEKIPEKTTINSTIEKPEVEEEKPKEESNPAFSKPNLFKKPFAKKEQKTEDTSSKIEESLQKSEVNQGNQQLSLNNDFLPKKQEPKLDFSSNQSNKNEQVFLTDSLLSKDKKPEQKIGQLNLPDFLQDSKKPLDSKKNEPLRLSEEFQPKKKEDNTIESNNTNKLLAEVPIDESVHLGGVSRINKGRRNRGQDQKADDFDTSVNTLKANDLNENKAKEIGDPFAKFDNPGNLDLSKKDKKILDINEKKAEPPKNQFEHIGLFNPPEETIQKKNNPVNKQDNIAAGLFAPDDMSSALSKVQMRKGPRDRALGNNNTGDDLFGNPEPKKEVQEPKLDFSVKDNTTTIGNKPKKISMLAGGHDDPFGSNDKKDDFGFKSDTNKNDLFSKQTDDIFSKKEDPFNLNEKPAQKDEKFSLAPADDADGIGSKPRRMKMGAKKEEAKEKQVNLAMKAEKQGGGGFFDEFDV